VLTIIPTCVVFGGGKNRTAMLPNFTIVFFISP